MVRALPLQSTHSVVDVPAARAPLILLSAGETSGDRHAAAFFSALRNLLPEVQGIGMGGVKMREAGVDILVDSSALGVIGTVEVLRHYPTLLGALTSLRDVLKRRRPDLVVCIDYKEFNFRLAKTAKALGIPVLFYVSPQVWAWRPGRVRTYAKLVTRMAVIFPFEVDFYARYGISVDFVGHPLADSVKTTLPRDAARARRGLGAEHTVVGLFPGSRSGEIKRLLPPMLEAARHLFQIRPDMRFLLFHAASIPMADLAEPVVASKLPITIATGGDYEDMQCCDIALTKSGTTTLELALLAIPMVIVYRLAPISYLLGRWLVNVAHIGLPNIIAGRTVVPELIQHAANSVAMVREVERYLDDPRYRERTAAELAQVRERLGDGGSARRLASLAQSMLRDGLTPLSSPSALAQGEDRT